jgi:hypothetical protein
MMDEPTIREIREILAKITPGDWAVSDFTEATGVSHITLATHTNRPVGASVDRGFCRDHYQASIASIGAHRCHISSQESAANSIFIASAPRFIRFLLAQIESLEAQKETPPSCPIE